MKKIFYLLIFVSAFADISKAQNVIAVEHGSTTTFYARLDTALINAQNGDNLYLPGGYITTYSGILKINKVLNIYGVGYNADSSPVVGNTILNSSIEIATTSSGGSITGISAGGITIHDTVSNYKVCRCYFSNITIGGALSSLPASNISIIETIVNNNILGYCNAIMYPQNVLILNCFIGNIAYGTAPFYSNNYVWNGLVCRNSILFGYPVGTNFNFSFLSALKYSFFENCIMINLNPSLFGGYNNTFKNCLFNSSSFYPGPNNLIYNCIYNQSIDTTFVNHQGNYFDFHYNYHLKSSSPGKNAGTDGQDLGIYGGNYPWKEGGIPFNPHIQYRKVGGTTDGSGNLPVQIKVKAQDN